jgi:hypothetical protein
VEAILLARPPNSTRGVEMGLGDLLGRIFGSTSATPPDAPKLSGTSESVLGSSVQHLPAGERGWITQTEATHLFSDQEPQYAFGELDEAGKARLEQFASRYGCTFSFMPTEGRVYFTRNG